MEFEVDSADLQTPFQKYCIFRDLFLYLYPMHFSRKGNADWEEFEGRSTIFYTSSPEETIQLGQFIGEVLKPGSVIGLCGELGTGKTHLIKGLARGLGVDERYYVTSPSFTIINEYPGRIPLNHLDLYRLENTDQMEELGYEEYFYREGVTVIEWAEKVLPLLPENRLMVEISHLSENRRKFKITGRGHPYQDIVGEIIHWKADIPFADNE
jgi:tRNA threonylcarbamoyladenosine biosynthesis protein TsaE